MIRTSWHQLDVRCYVNFKFKNSVLKRYFIFDWKREDGVWFLWRRFFAKVNIGSLPTYWEVFCQVAEGSSWKYLVGVTQKYWGWSQKSTMRFSLKYWDVFCKNTKSCSENMLWGFLQKYWEIFCKNTERCSEKLLPRGL